MSCCQPLPPDTKLRAAACLFCPHAEVVSGNPVACTINGQGILRVAAAAACPVQRVSGDGIVRWLVRWYGLPMPHRLYLWLRHPSHPSPFSWSGCGCVVFLKDLFRRLTFAKR